MLLVSAAEFPSQMRLLAQPGPGQPPTSKGELPQPLPAEIVKAWQEAGATVGWMRVYQYGFVHFVSEDAGEPGDVLAFRFAEWKAGVLGRLPPPEAGFGLYLGGTKVTDAGLKELAGLKSLQTLNLVGTQVTDAGLKELAGLKSLQTLNLNDTQVTDAGLKELAGLKLKFLFIPDRAKTDLGLKHYLAALEAPANLSLDWSLHAWQLTDAGLKELAGLKSLQSLDLSGTQVTDAGLKELAGQKSLQWLNLYRTKVSDAGLKELAGLKSLQTLNLNDTQVTDAGLKELGGLKSLQTLALSATKVTDAGLKELAGLTSLQTLVLNDTEVTDAGIAELRKALPDCRIIR
jgi:hypothetical protein